MKARRIANEGKKVLAKERRLIMAIEKKRFGKLKMVRRKFYFFIMLSHFLQLLNL